MLSTNNFNKSLANESSITLKPTVAVLEAPFILHVIVTTPLPTAVTTPFWSTVAILLSLDDQVTVVPLSTLSSVAVTLTVSPAFKIPFPSYLNSRTLYSLTVNVASHLIDVSFA